MEPENKELVGFACAYTPLALIDAAGFAPYRLLPTGDWPEQAGRLLHDNICPHVKRLLDRALQGDVPDLALLLPRTPARESISICPPAPPCPSRERGTRFSVLIQMRARQRVPAGRTIH